MQREWTFAALNTLKPPFMVYATATMFHAGEPWSASRLPGCIMARIDKRLRHRTHLARRSGSAAIWGRAIC